MGGETEVRGISQAKRWLIWPALILAGLGGLAALLLFTWPQESRERTRFDMGPLDGYAVGSVTTIRRRRIPPRAIERRDVHRALMDRLPFSTVHGALEA